MILKHLSSHWNPYRVEPTRYMKKKESKIAIRCNPCYGPLFGNKSPDIFIADNCNGENSCWINSSSAFQYDFHTAYKSSLYVDTNEYNNINRFSVLDYEVYTHN